MLDKEVLTVWLWQTQCAVCEVDANTILLRFAHQETLSALLVPVTQESSAALGKLDSERWQAI